MKKILSAFLLALVFQAAGAQVSVAAKAGLNLASIGGKDTRDYSSKAGIYFGAQAGIPVTRQFQVLPELYFSTQGARWPDAGEKSAWSYLQLPVLARYRHESGFFAEAGPQIGFLLSAHDTYDGEKNDVKEFLSTTDFSLAFGAGYMVTEKLGLNLRYNASLSKFYEEEKNRFFSIGASWKLK